MAQIIGKVDNVGHPCLVKINMDFQKFHFTEAIYMPLTLTVLVTTIDSCNTLKQDNDSTVRGDGGSRVGEVRAGTTSPMPKHKGFKLQ